MKSQTCNVKTTDWGYSLPPILTDSWASSLIVNVRQETCCHGALFWSPQIANKSQNYSCFSLVQKRKWQHVIHLKIKMVLLWTLYSVLTYWRHAFIRTLTNVRLTQQHVLYYYTLFTPKKSQDVDDAGWKEVAFFHPRLWAKKKKKSKNTVSFHEKEFASEHLS